MLISGLGFLELRAQGNEGRVLTSLIGLLSHLFGSGVTPERASHVSGTKYLFVFGDSYTATGFDINGTKPSTRNPIGNPDLPGWTSSGGLNWPGHLATEFNTSLTYAYVLAVGGSTVDNSIIPAYSPWVPSLSDQVRTWTVHLAPRPGYAPWTPKNALFAVWIGVNDVGNSFSQPGEEVRLNRDLDRLFDLLGKLYANGARRFALLNIPPTQKTPMMNGLSSTDMARLIFAIAWWNTQLPARVAAFMSANSGASATLVDTQRPWNAVLANPKRYGSPDANCVNPDGKSCLWHDGYHPGLAIQHAVAKTVAEMFKDTFF